MSDVETPSVESVGTLPEARKTRPRRDTEQTKRRKSATQTVNQGKAEERAITDWEKPMLELIKEMKEDNRVRNEALVLMHQQANNRAEELLELHRQTNKGGKAHPEGRGSTPRDHIRRKGIASSEEGTNMRSFLGVVEQEFRESEVPMEEWGGLLGKYLTGKAMTFLAFLKQPGVYMTDWKEVRDRLCERFCSLSREKMIDLLAENQWTGDYSEYINRFTKVVAQGERVPGEELVTLFFTLLPSDIGELISCDGTKTFHDWQEAATALRNWAMPLEAWRARRNRGVKEFTARGKRRPGADLISFGRTAPAIGKGGPPDKGGVSRSDTIWTNRRVERDYPTCGSGSGNQTIKRKGLGVQGDVRTRPKQPIGDPKDQDASEPGATNVSPSWRKDETGARMEGENSGKGRERNQVHPWRPVRLTDGRTEANPRRHAMLVGDSTGTDNGCEVNGSGRVKTSGTDTDTREGESERTAESGTKHDNGTVPTEGPAEKETTNPGNGGCAEGEQVLPWWMWWQEGDADKCTQEYLGPLCGVGETAVLKLEITGRGYEGLLDTGASRSFIRPAVVEQLGLKMQTLREAFSFTVANGAIIHIDKEVPRLTMLCGGECFTGNFLVGPIPFPIILGIDWLVNHKVAWYFQSDKIRTYVNGRWCDLPVLRRGGATSTQDNTTPKEQIKTAADRAYEELAAQVAKMSVEEAKALLRPPPKRYKSRHRAGERVRIKDILQKAREDTANLKGALEGLHLVVALPATEPERVVRVPTERQGPLLYALVEYAKSLPNRQAQTLNGPEESADTTQTEDDESPWPRAQLSFTEFDAWITDLVNTPYNHGSNAVLVVK
ncbi:uncharacterized protein EMH_0006090 [Eimeria mitis]|uniref:Retrotransposon gag domain-containing protein n=1 Tax=Eimeria mitis TaxID=44415 RepID=U6JXZ9_9EIME|nr:uncharacterized protein EMH_0006090 [Eimeria mitis]CDJ30319.1 hypothetical protein EMH_0006090 [Eimeria mitis]